MADRYTTRASWDPDWWSEGPTQINVYEKEERPVDTGLLDAYGMKLYRVPEKRQIGFQCPVSSRRSIPTRPPSILLF